jgi:tripartite-type tricarboxylate transporter receptor subunit TctC
MRSTNSLLGIKPTLVPFTGTGPAANALVGGQVDYMLNGIVEVGSLVQSGAIKAYAIGARERSPVLPDVPTTKEAGLPEFEASPWFALFAPRDTPRPIVDKLSDALDRALDDQGVRKRLLELGGYIPVKAMRGPQPLAALLKVETARWATIIKTANVKGE